MILYVEGRVSVQHGLEDLVDCETWHSLPVCEEAPRIRMTLREFNEWLVCSGKLRTQIMQIVRGLSPGVSCAWAGNVGCDSSGEEFTNHLVICVARQE